MINIFSKFGLSEKDIQNCYKKSFVDNNEDNFEIVLVDGENYDGNRPLYYNWVKKLYDEYFFSKNISFFQPA